MTCHKVTFPQEILSSIKIIIESKEIQGRKRIYFVKSAQNAMTVYLNNPSSLQHLQMLHLGTSLYTFVYILISDQSEQSKSD